MEWKRPKGVFDHSKFAHMARYEKFLQELQIQTNVEFKVDVESKKLKFRDLTGPEKVKLFKGFKVSELISAEEELPIKKTREQIQALWDKFFEIYEMLRSDHFNDAECNAMESLIISWFENNFLELLASKDVTPYIHVLRHHVLEFLKKYRNLNYFNQQGLEKLVAKGFLEDKGCQSQKNEYRCANCGTVGHLILSCKSKCTREGCDELICSELLEDRCPLSPDVGSQVFDG